LHEAIPDRMSDPVELPLLWLLSDPSVSAVLCGASAPWQVRQIAETARRPSMTAAERELITWTAKEIFVGGAHTKAEQ
jgi:predicted aldo/keto reductase-like oxidoreductase